MKLLYTPFLKAPFKRLPSWITAGTRECATSLIAGMCDGDGYCVRDAKRIGFNSASEQLIRGLQLLLTNLGIISRVTRHVTPPTKKVKVSSVQWRLTITGQNVDKFRDIIQLRIKRKADILNSYQIGRAHV